MSNTEIREVRVVPQKSADGTLWSLLVPTCPFCYGQHLHGAGSGAS